MQIATFTPPGSGDGGGKFANGAVTGAFGYLFNHCLHSQCWVDSEEQKLLDSGDAVKFDKLMCAHGDPYLCFGAHSAAGDDFWGSASQYRFALYYYDAHGYAPSLKTMSAVALDLARAYAAYLGDSESQGKWPSAFDISQQHNAVFAKYGVPPEAFGGTPGYLGTMMPHYSSWFTSHVIPGWCSTCRP